MTEFEAVAAADGHAMGEAFIFRHDEMVVPHFHVKKDGVEDEISALRASFASVRGYCSDQLGKAVSDSERALYSVQILMIDDPEWLQAIEGYIKKDLYNAAWAVECATSDIVAALSSVEDEYMKERIIDIVDIQKAVTEELTGKARRHIRLVRDVVLVADNLLTSELLALEGIQHLKAICLDAGGKTSHVSILAKSWGIPAVVGLKDFSLQVKEGECIIVDGYEGRVMASPGKKQIAGYGKRKQEQEAEEARLIRNAELLARTADGIRIVLEANVEDRLGIGDAIKAGCEGIGLFRTEFLEMKYGATEDFSVREGLYDEIASSMLGHGRVTFRTLDIGGDKFINGLSGQEDNPLLGWRAVRFCLDRKDIFKSQIISILKASRHGNVRMMFPMISTVEELESCLLLLDEAKKELGKKRIPFDPKMKVGTMIEVPSAALISDTLASMVDFVSIGTNDLVQYVLAVDRGNEKISHLYRADNPAVLRLVKMVVDNCHDKKIPVGICGQIASEVDMLPLLVGFGCDSLSMPPLSVGRIKERLGTLSKPDCENLLNNVLSMNSHERVAEMLKEFNNGRKT